MSPATETRISPETQTPELGDMVKFTFSDNEFTPGALNEVGQSNPVPAMIVAVWSDTCVNLRVFPDGPGNALWQTSIQRKDEAGEDESYWEFYD